MPAKKKSPSKKKSDNSIIDDLLVEQLNQKLGGVAYVMGKDDTPTEVKHWYTTGSAQLDTIITNDADKRGGIPVGKLVEISGESQTGKSMLSYIILKDCLDQGGVPVLIDTENAANISFLQLLGLDPYNSPFTLVQVDTVEKVFSAIEEIIKLIKTNEPNRQVCIVWDSVAATSTDQEVRNDYDENTIGLFARRMGQGLRKTIRMIGTHNVSLIFLNQLRKNIGVMFGDDTITPGGSALPFMASVRIKLFNAGKIKSSDNKVIGAKVRAKIIKNRFGPPLGECEFKVYFNRGLVDHENWLDVLLKAGIAQKISAQKSAIVINGVSHEFKNRSFLDYVDENPEFKRDCAVLVKKALVTEQHKTISYQDEIIEEVKSDEEI